MNKVEAMLFLIKPINKQKSLYINAFNKKDWASIDKKISNKSKAIVILDVKQITSKSKYTNSIRSKSRIQSIQNRFKLIEFDDNIKEQVGRPIDRENTITYMADMADIPID